MARLVPWLLVFALAACDSKDDTTEDTDTSSDAEPPCTENDIRCTGDFAVLEGCVDGEWTFVEDCASQDLVCHDEMGHCMMM